MEWRVIGAILGECFRVFGLGSRSIVFDEAENRIMLGRLMTEKSLSPNDLMEFEQKLSDVHAKLSRLERIDKIFESQSNQFSRIDSQLDESEHLMKD